MGNRMQAGFTLLELLIVIMITGILAAMIAPRFGNASLVAACNADLNNIQIINQQIELYKVNTNYWPEFPKMESLLLSNTYFPDGGMVIEPFAYYVKKVAGVKALGIYTPDLRGDPPRWRVYTENHLSAGIYYQFGHADCGLVLGLP